MRKAVSLRVFLMVIVCLMALIASGFIAWLLVLAEHDAQLVHDNSFAVHIGEFTVRASADAARERGHTTKLIGQTLNRTQAELEQLASLRERIDDNHRELQHWVAEAAGNAPKNIMHTMADLRQRYADLIQARQVVDARLYGQGSQITEPAWYNTVTQYIDELTRLRRHVYIALGDYEGSVAQQIFLLEQIHRVSEYAGRERALITASINTGRPLSAETLEQLHNYRASVEESLAIIEDMGEHYIQADFQRGMQRIHNNFLGQFELVRQSVYDASRNHRPYPLPASAWYEMASEALNDLVALSGLISKNEITRAESRIRKIEMATALIIVTGALLAGLVIVTAFVIRLRVLLPINALIDASQAIAQGNLAVPIKPVRNDELGKLAQALAAMAGELSARQREERLSWSRLEAVINNSHEAILTTDDEGRITLFNKGAEVIFGYTADEMLGEPIERLLPARFVADHAAHMRRFAEEPVMSRDMRSRNAIQGRRKDGSEFPAEASIAKIPTDHTFIFTVILRDISERLRAEEVQSHLTSILESTTDFVATADPHGQLQYLNRAGRLMVGLPEQADLTDMRIPDFHSVASQAVVMDKALPLAIRDGFWHGEIELLHRDGHPVPVSSLILAHKDVSGNLAYFSTIMRDISERKRSEDKLQTFGRVLDNTLNEIYMFDAATLKFTQVNQGALHNLGYTMDELRQMTPVNIKPLLTRAEFEQLLDTLHATEDKRLTFETVHQRKDGSRYPVEVRLQYSQSESMPLYVAIVSDITERQHAEEARRKLLAIIESTPDLVGTSDTQGQLTFLNRAGRRQLGLDYEQPLDGLMICDFLAPWSVSQYQHEARPYALRDGSWQGDSTLLAKGGHEVPVLHQILMHQGTDGQMFLSFSMRNITELAQAQDELRLRNRDLQAAYSEIEHAQAQLLQSEKMASIGQLAAGVAHEINNPVGYVNSNLGTLQGYINDLFQMLDAYGKGEALLTADPVLKSEIKSLKQKLDLNYLRDDTLNLMNESREGLNRVKKIVQDLKEFSHVDRAEWQQANLHLGLDSTLNIVHNELKYKAEVVKIYGTLPAVDCIPAQLNQVFMNLLVNAAQAIEARGTITLRTGTEEEGVFIEISDTGKGMPKEVQNRIFEPFYTTKEVGKGTGLGLSLSYNIIKKHKGSIEVTSEPGKGTTFRVWLPILHDTTEE